MFHAFGQAKRSLDLSRPIGAVITNKENEILAVGCNDVNGLGHPLSQEKSADIPAFDYSKGSNFNKKQISLLADNVVKVLKEEYTFDDNNFESLKQKLEDNALDIIGYHRTVCAEMAAIMDSARRGVSIRDGTVYSTTFPCHICMKHIISAGISKVVYIEPYPKSKTSDMFNDFVNESVSCVCNDKVNVIPYIGVAPNRYLYVYSPDYRDRKEYTKERKDFKPTVPKHLKHKYSFCYQEQENSIIAHLEELLAGDAETDKSWWSRNLSDKPLEKV